MNWWRRAVCAVVGHKWAASWNHTADTNFERIVNECARCGRTK